LPKADDIFDHVTAKHSHDHDHDNEYDYAKVKIGNTEIHVDT